MSTKHRKNKKSFFGRPVWRNSTKTMKVNPQRYYQPSTLQDLIEMVQEGIDTDTPVRAVGSGHSFSTAPKAEGILLDTDRLNKFAPYSFTTRQGIFFDIEGGIKLHDLNARLDKLGYAISTMGGIDHQSVAGAISTGTHGSSLQLGAMYQMIRSLVLVTHDLQNPSQAKAYRIERSGDQAFTDPSLYNGPELIADDEIFYSAIMCFGSMGIIYSYVLEVEKMYYLEEKKEAETWSKVAEKLQDKRIFQDHRSVFVQVNPYPYKGEQLALILTHDRHDQPRHNLTVQNIKHKFWYRLKRSTRSLQFELAARVPYIVWFAIWRVNTFPGYVPKFLHSAIRSQRDEMYFNKAPKVMYQGLDYIKDRAFDCEIVLPMDEEGKYLQVLNELFAYLQHLHNEYQIHLTSPVGLRFVKGSEAPLSAEYRQDVCYVDTPVLLQVYGRDTIISRVQQFVRQKNVRLHWGKLNYYLDEEYVKSHYPGYDNFMKVMKKFNPRQVFSNIFTKQMLGY